MTLLAWAPLKLQYRCRCGWLAERGFGSNLRAAGNETQIDNFDSCRDLQGRRIRHNTAAQMLEEWQAEAEERDEREKVVSSGI